MEPTVKLNPLFNEIATAIHEKDGLSDAIYAYNFPERIRAIPSNGVWVESIEIVSPPLKSNYITGEDFDPTGLKIVAKFSNGQTFPVDISDLTFSPSESLEEGTDSISIGFQWGLRMVYASQPVQVHDVLWWSPMMTSNQTPVPYIVTAINEYTDNQGYKDAAYKAFDGKDGSSRGEFWYGIGSNAWITFNFGTNLKNVYAVRLLPTTVHPTVFPKEITVQYMDDSSNYVDIVYDNGKNYDPNTHEWRVISFPAPVKAKIYRFYFGEKAYGGLTQAVISEIEFSVDEI